MNADPSLLFVHIGKTLPPWLMPAIRQARFFNACPIYLAAAREALASAKLPALLKVSPIELESLEASHMHERFRATSKLDRDFWNGFWTHTTERFFIIEEVMTTLGLRNVVHLENDVLLYADLTELAPRLQRIYVGAAATFISDELCVAGIMYFPDAGATSRLCQALLQAVDGADGIPLPPGLRRHCDMSLLAAIRTRDEGVLDDLPVLAPDYPNPLRDASGRAPHDPARYSRHFDELGFIFDAAVLGQYLGGVDPRNAQGPTLGFVNPSSVFDPRLLRPRIGLDATRRRVPEIVTRSGVHRVANLHIHSKNPQPFLSR